MKIRNGFVSNSSSSSFIIRKSEMFPDTITIAENMIKDLIKDYNDYGHEYYCERDIIQNIKYLKDKYPNVPIMFNSTNYDTYIMDIGEGYFYIDTCNNTNWYIKSFSEYKLPEILEKKYNESELDFCNSTEVYFHKQDDMEFFKLDSGFFIQHTDKFESCKKCYSELFKIDGKKYCLRCDSDKINRSLKINKILKKCKH